MDRAIRGELEPVHLLSMPATTPIQTGATQGPSVQTERLTLLIPSTRSLARSWRTVWADITTARAGIQLENFKALKTLASQTVCTQISFARQVLESRPSYTLSI